MNSKIIAVDFDGTLCENKWPEIGKPHTDVIEYVKKRKNAGDKLICGPIEWKIGWMQQYNGVESKGLYSML